MPFIATDEAYRGRTKNWIGRYGFRCLEVSMKKEIMAHNILMFYDSVRLEKISILSYMIEAWNKPEESELHKFNVIEIEGNASDLYDDSCMIWAANHQVCIGFPKRLVWRANSSRINFKDLYTTILEKDDDIILVASFRYKTFT
ncbi:hypothetical protein BUALT_Bualt10G0019700 [Buddleja alternifolia]|uniref:Uncharacterized protein n=1 Tax=Buddleja alternifolia TaxID=168488 RepID=A0AAV6WUL7_9LAMI|nr:hypothetical protein BUALT_Bualt10G0019700 [Buddleja alternifolia]